MTAATPLEPAPPGLAFGSRVLLKREDAHELGAFKWRGALPTVSRLRDRGATTVVTASTGNHGAATAWAAQRLGLQAIVYVPVGAAAGKLALIEGLDAELREGGADLDEAKAAGRAWATGRALPFFEDGDEPDQYDGYEAIGEEIVDQLGEPPAAVVIPIGNGALAIGVGRALARRSPRTSRVGVVAARAPVMADSLAAGTPVASSSSETFADGLAIRVAIPRAVRELRAAIDRVERVSERAIARAVGAYAAAGIRAEGAAASALAALPALEATGTVVLLVTGRNIDDELFRRATAQPETFAD